MKGYVSVVYVGSGIFRHPAFLSYIRRESGRLGLRIGREEYIGDLDENMPLSFQKLLEENSVLLIAADRQNFSLASRILATVTGDTLTVSNDMLVPAGAGEIHKGGSVLYRYSHRSVNLLRATPGETFPPILLEPVGRSSWHFFPRREKEWTELFKSLLPENGHFEYTRIIPGWIRLDCYGEENINSFETLIEPYMKRMLPGDSPVDAMIRYLSHERKTVTFAESCTGGRLAAAFTGRSGSSEIFKGSYVTYSNRIKHKWLDVPMDILELHGAVSSECVEAMARGALKNSGSDIAVAISGIAGPSGAVPGKPVGTVYVCVYNGISLLNRRLQLEGDRNFIQEQTVYHSLKMMIENDEKIFDFFSGQPLTT